MTERKKIKYHQLTHGLDVENLSISTSILQKYIGWVYFTVLSYGLHYDHTTLNEALWLSICLPKVIEKRLYDRCSDWDGYHCFIFFV